MTQLVNKLIDVDMSQLILHEFDIKNWLQRADPAIQLSISGPRVRLLPSDYVGYCAAISACQMYQDGSTFQPPGMVLKPCK